ncbi:Phosphatidylinositol-4-phosphate 5-kinase [Spironucleus salmonicida]|uniref:Phosphatidylinositol-4-phosphate 5-kinase n=1 Tax=Spironucleus salmonicida TaxID=348837 RepID=V6LX35_9EUKA|nr:Phosphatidylinositol-4-phosphate 5-kinase [Spironucleus salmonicida]|eukprot:EST48271.1 Phosphatidylinositol-4-phosphate 5-kinase [Spironucleus salmonicida]
MKSLLTPLHSMLTNLKPKIGSPITITVKPLFRTLQLALSLFSTIDNYPKTNQIFDLGLAFDPDTELYTPQAQLTLHFNESFRKLRLSRHFQNELINAEFVETADVGFAQSEGKSGLLFFFSATTRFLLKQIKNSELAILTKISREYCDHVCQNSFIIPYYTVFTLKINGENYHFTLMDNAFLGDIKYKYDLKGSTAGRTSKPNESTMKDNNLDRKFSLGLYRREFGHQLASDIEKLTKWGLLDYSMLIGVFAGDRKNYQIPVIQSIQISETEYISFAIIDILTVYTRRKTLERFFKQFTSDLKQISAQKPQVYGQRFEERMLRVFAK